MSGAVEAGIWGLVAGSSLLLGAALGVGFRLPQRLIAGVMAFGAGTMVSTLAFDFMEEAYHRGGLVASAGGFLGGALAFTIANGFLTRRGALHRKRSEGQQPSEAEHAGSGLAIAAGALLDGVPESVAIGASLLAGGAVSWVAVVAIFLSNLPEALSSAAGMRHAGRSPRYIFGVWGGITLASGVASWTGYAVLGGMEPAVVATTTAVAAGGILAMLVDTMIPEAYERTHNAAGLITGLGFLCAFVLSEITR